LRLNQSEFLEETSTYFMIEVIANNPLLAPFPIVTLVAGMLVLLLILFWLIPLEKKLKRIEEKVSSLLEADTDSKPNDPIHPSQNTRFSALYQQNLESEEGLNPQSVRAGPLDLKTERDYQSSTDNLVKQSIGRRNRINNG